MTCCCLGLSERFFVICPFAFDGAQQSMQFGPGESGRTHGDTQGSQSQALHTACTRVVRDHTVKIQSISELAQSEPEGYSGGCGGPYLDMTVFASLTTFCGTSMDHYAGDIRKEKTRRSISVDSFSAFPSAFCKGSPALSST